MRQFARSAPSRPAVLPSPRPRRAVAALLPGSLVLLLSGCAGVGNYFNSTLNPLGDPNAPAGDAINMQRARGNEVAVQPLRPQPGDVWPGKLAPVPTLGEIQKHMNVPLGQAYQNLYSAPAGSSPAPSYSVPPGAKVRRLPPDRAEGAEATFSRPAGAAMHSSTPPGSAQAPVPRAPAIPTAPARPAKPITSGDSLPVGQTVMGPHGPLGIVTSPSNGRYQTIAPIGGRGGGILIPNGNGTATLIQSNGQVVTVPTR
ncbi:hypothetical protein ICJ77_15570 [Acidiphilium multivorum]|jgi:hypothetical protein|uniref:Uncharacterized protein n=1 Tax=Acidiphilium cryptum (strain JF-5) TaxID=349163 RepID=A5FZJ7_ACICJ|nr:hypothetical protein [Acidiphilium multivorum]ABQ31029.1 hypothetical protein Acry_1827 [Acidiphilium cryptum JF-5]EGO93498.1 hypothetical protein APM_3832 [Acidiphilium sp. PM]KDM67361.1 hypothetical protein ACIDI_36c00050 [Acidiphilium sp. JA12-A1]MBU6357711.1 hypothetical protein [Rhodospirillales bacterium]MBS3025189.1 hypothetical protein [Acidiphilium multivorum]